MGSCLVNDWMAAFVFEESEVLFLSEKTSCITINCGCCGNNDGTIPAPVTGDGTPVGTILSYMGTKAPQHYIACDGAVLNIADYEALARQIEEEFGSVDYFGGDGVETFAVPELRNEFLRGYRGEAEAQLSGDVGKHQEATSIPAILVYNDGGGTICYPGTAPETFLGPINMDSMSKPLDANKYASVSVGIGNTGYGKTYMPRPTNVAVLYCIKYE